MKKCKNILIIKTSTWNKDSNELLDYESSNLIKSSYSIETNGYLSRSEDDIHFIKNPNESLGKNEKLLVYLDCTSKQFYLQNNFPLKNSADETWLSLRALKNKKYSSGYLLNQGDIIRLGRIKFKIRDIKIEGRAVLGAFDLYKENTMKVTGNFQTTVKNYEKSKKICRICYCDEIEADSPLINPCNCSGGLKYIHFSCLQQWLKSKAVLKSASTDNCIMYTFQQIECEICKHMLPDFVKLNSKLYEIWDFIKPTFKNYISLETIPSDKNSNSTKSIYIVGFDNKSAIKIGRSHENDLRITDISVSRFHAQIIKQMDSTLLLQDNTSKFGSLIYLQNQRMPIFTSPVLPLQIGRSLINLFLKAPFSFFQCFHCGSNSPCREVDYGAINSESIVVENIFSVKVQVDDDKDQESEVSHPKIIDEYTVFEEKNWLDHYNTENKCQQEIEYGDYIIKRSNLSIDNGCQEMFGKIPGGMIEQMNNLNCANNDNDDDDDNDNDNDNDEDKDDIPSIQDSIENKHTKWKAIIPGKLHNIKCVNKSNPLIKINHCRSSHQMPAVFPNHSIQVVLPQGQAINTSTDDAHNLKNPIKISRNSVNPIRINFNFFKQYEEDVTNNHNDHPSQIQNNISPSRKSNIDISQI